MKFNQNLIIELNYNANELAWVNFYREGCKKPFESIDGGYCTHEQFIFLRDELIAKEMYATVFAAIAVELNKEFKNYKVVKKYN